MFSQKKKMTVGIQNFVVLIVSDEVDGDEICDATATFFKVAIY